MQRFKDLQKGQGRWSKCFSNQQSQIFIGISHYLPNICFCKTLFAQLLQFPAAPVSSFSSSQLLQSHTGCSKLVRSPSPRNDPFQSALPSGSQPLNPCCASSQVHREAEDTPARSLPSHLLQPEKEDSCAEGGRGDLPQQ